MSVRAVSAAAMLAATLMFIPACGSPKGSVSSSELGKVQSADQTLTTGMTKDQALGQFKTANKVRLSSADIDNATIEEWKVEAFHDSGKGRTLFVRFLYFRNDVLVDMSDQRLDFRNNPDIAKRWAASSAPASK